MSNLYFYLILNVVLIIMIIVTQISHMKKMKILKKRRKVLSEIERRYTLNNKKLKEWNILPDHEKFFTLDELSNLDEDLFKLNVHKKGY